MGKRNGRWHELQRFIAGKAKHQPLIAGALLGSSFSVRRNAIDTLFDIARLLAHLPNHPAGVCVKTAIAVHVSDVTDRSAHALFKIKLRVGRNFTGQDDEVAFCESFTSHAAQRILLKTYVENVIAYRVANLVGMAFSDRLGRKNVTARHGFCGVTGYKSYNVKSDAGNGRS